MSWRRAGVVAAMGVSCLAPNNVPMVRCCAAGVAAVSAATARFVRRPPDFSCAAEEESQTPAACACQP